MLTATAPLQSRAGDAVAPPQNQRIAIRLAVLRAAERSASSPFFRM